MIKNKNITNLESVEDKEIILQLSELANSDEIIITRIIERLRKEGNRN